MNVISETRCGRKHTQLTRCRENKSRIPVRVYSIMLKEHIPRSWLKALTKQSNCFVLSEKRQIVHHLQTPQRHSESEFAAAYAEHHIRESLLRIILIGFAVYIINQKINASIRLSRKNKLLRHFSTCTTNSSITAAPSLRRCSQISREFATAGCSGTKM